MGAPGELIEGFRRFRARHFSENDAIYRHLVTDGQSPDVLIVACCDSRVDPAIVLDCAPGDLFVIRNVANLVPPAEDRAGHHGTTAALEYGVRILHVKHIIVLGHAQCGGIRTLLTTQGADNPNSFIDDWMRLAEPARQEVERTLPDAPPAIRMRACEQHAVGVSLQNLMTFPWIRERVEDGSLTLHGWYFDIENGQLLGYNDTAHGFEKL
ncbi:MAG: carbonic anhydrase [Nitrosomonadales bacterium]|nr:carbonic anhydrase [Nitrosomonadales bacterium]